MVSARIRAPYLIGALQLPDDLAQLFWAKRKLTRDEKQKLAAGIRACMSSVRKARHLWEDQEAAAAAYRPRRSRRRSDY